MLKIIQDVARARRWQATRRKIQEDAGPVRHKLLRRFGDDIRTMAPLIAKASAETWDISSSLELATSLGVVVGGWANMFPANPEWPGRDRLFLARREDAVSVCAALASLGFFHPDQAAGILDDAMVGAGFIHGVEHPGAPAEDIPALAWESALESARNKRKWQDQFMTNDGSPGPDWVAPDWAAAEWAASPAAWRTCVILDAGEAPAEELCGFPARSLGTGERPAGLVALLPAPKNDADTLASEWNDAGWEAVAVKRTDCLALYAALSAAPGERPLAVVLAMAQSSVSQAMARIQLRRKEAEMLAELPDDQFNALIGEALNF